MPQDIFKALPLVDVDASTLGVLFRPLNAPGFAQPVVYLKIINDSDVALRLSYDGVTAEDIILSNTSEVIFPPICALPNNRTASFSAHTILYGICPAATGHIYIVAYYV